MTLSLKLLILLGILDNVSAATGIAPLQARDLNINTEKHPTSSVIIKNTEETFLRKLFNSKSLSETAHANAAKYALENIYTYSPKSLHLIGSLLLKANQRFVGALCLEQFIETSTPDTNPTHVLETAKFFHKHNPILAAKGYEFVLNCKIASMEQQQEARKGLNTLKRN